jgi:branched-chain amino acid aminotransferase
MHSMPLQRTARSRRPGLDLPTVPFGTIYSDHMVVARYEDGDWHGAELRPFGPLELLPTISGLHYGLSIFEGQKAHRSPGGDLLLFRPWENARRFARSAARMAMPAVPETMYLESLRALVRLDETWVPSHGTGALYIRPLLFSVDPSIRVKPGDRFLFVIITLPFGAYYSGAVDLLVTERYVRAFKGGTGEVKPGGNYGSTLVAEMEARDAQCATVMWLDGIEHRYVEECGVMNMFFVLDDRVVTPALGGTVLPGITRDSVITLLRDAGLVLEERRIGIDEIVEAHAMGRLRESCGVGTAATVSHVGRIRYRGQDLVLPPIEARTVGPAVRDRLIGIMSGRISDPFDWVEPLSMEP